MQYPKSYELYERAQKSISGGLHSNSRFRKPHPIYFCKAQGPYITDLDNNLYIDLVMGNGTLILGHNNPEFNRLFAQYLEKNAGLITGFDTPLSVSCAERFLAMTGHERVRFTNTGTEAITHCLHIARSYTGRQRIAVMEGAYNGWTDAIYVNTFAPLESVGPADAPNSVPGTDGLDEQVVKNTIVLPFNNIEATERIVTAHKDELAAIILEPIMIDIGFVEATPEYIHFLREICDRYRILLVFDELLTGFRIGLGGCQKYYDTKCDLSIFGKALANGYILAAVAGKADVLAISAPGKKTAFVGTFNGHQISLCAAAATFDMIESGEVTETIMANSEYLRKSYNQLAKAHNIPSMMLGKGGHFQVYFTDKEPTDYRSAAISDPVHYEKYVQSLQEHGVWCSQNPLSHHALSYVHNKEIIDKVLFAMDKALDAALA